MTQENRSRKQLEGEPLTWSRHYLRSVRKHRPSSGPAWAEQPTWPRVHLLGKARFWKTLHCQPLWGALWGTAQGRWVSCHFSLPRYLIFEAEISTELRFHSPRRVTVPTLQSGQCGISSLAYYAILKYYSAIKGTLICMDLGDRMLITKSHSQKTTNV